jgi:hypothetical protein
MSQEELDLERTRFLNKLDKADVDVTDWEAKFIETGLARTWHSPKQREIIDKLIDKYGSRIKW